MALRISLFVIAAALMAAHFFRMGSFFVGGLCLATPLLFYYRSRWSLIVLQLAAYVASASWLGTALQLVQFRQQIDRPWTTAAVILGSVALFTLVAGLLLNARSLRERYPF